MNVAKKIIFHLANFFSKQQICLLTRDWEEVQTCRAWQECSRVTSILQEFTIGESIPFRHDIYCCTIKPPNECPISIGETGTSFRMKSAISPVCVYCKSITHWADSSEIIKKCSMIEPLLKLK